MNVSLSEIPGFSIADFLGRWSGARRAALVASTDAPHAIQGGASWDSAAEVAWVAGLNEEQLDRALRAVFDSSRKLAISASKRFSLQFDLDDFQTIFSASNIPCTAGHWTSRKAARVAEQRACPLLGTVNLQAVCQWFREAADGLVMGLGSTERYVRHRSQGYGDESCLDVIYDDGAGAEQGVLRWGPVPPPMSASLDSVVRDFARNGDTVKWVGYSAGTIFYSLNEGSIKPLCGTKARQKHEDLFSKVHHLVPELRMQDAAPLAVYGEGTK